MSYDLSGKQNPQWVGNACRTKLSTSAKIVSPSGSTIPMSSKKVGIPIWDSIPPNCTIEYEVLTQSDGQGKSDRVSLELQVFDLYYVGEVTNQVLDTLTDEELQLAIDDVPAFTEMITPKLEAKLDPKQVFKVIFSDRIITDEDGIATGSIALPTQYPPSQYNLMFHYGYEQASETTDSAKATEFWLKTALPLVIEIAFSVFVPGIGGVIVATAAATYDIAKMGNDFYETRFGIAGENQYGCIFPQGGFTHTYTFNIEPLEEAANLSNILTDENADLVSAMNSYIQLKGLGMVVLSGSVATLVLLLLINRMKRRDSS